MRSRTAMERQRSRTGPGAAARSARGCAPGVFSGGGMTEECGCAPAGLLATNGASPLRSRRSGRSAQRRRVMDKAKGAHRHSLHRARTRKMPAPLPFPSALGDPQGPARRHPRAPHMASALPRRACGPERTRRAIAGMSRPPEAVLPFHGALRSASRRGEASGSVASRPLHRQSHRRRMARPGELRAASPAFCGAASRLRGPAASSRSATGPARRAKAAQCRKRRSSCANGLCCLPETR